MIKAPIPSGVQLQWARAKHPLKLNKLLSTENHTHAHMSFSCVNWVVLLLMCTYLPLGKDHMSVAVWQDPAAKVRSHFSALTHMNLIPLVGIVRVLELH